MNVQVHLLVASTCIVSTGLVSTCLVSTGIASTCIASKGLACQVVPSTLIFLYILVCCICMYVDGKRELPHLVVCIMLTEYPILANGTVQQGMTSLIANNLIVNTPLLPAGSIISSVCWKCPTCCM